MFKIKSVPDVEVDVPIQVPGDDGQEASLKVRYRLLSVSEAKAVFEAPDDEKLGDDELMERDIVDIQGAADADGKPLPFDKELLHRLMDLNYVRPALVKGWLDVQSNRAQHAEKN